MAKKRKGYKCVTFKLRDENDNFIANIRGLIVRNFIIHIGIANISKYHISYMKNGYFHRFVGPEFDTEDEAIKFILKDVDPLRSFKPLSGTTPFEETDD